MQSLFYQNYRNPMHSFNHSLLHLSLLQAISLHPVKDSAFQHRLHNFYLMLRLQELRTRQLNLFNKRSRLNVHLRRTFVNELVHSRRIPLERLVSVRRALDAESLLKEDLFGGANVHLLHGSESPDDDTGNGQHSWRQDQQRVNASSVYANELQRRGQQQHPAYNYAWHAFDGAGRYFSKDALVPRLVVPPHLKLALHLLVDSAMLELNRDARQSSRVLDYKSINYGYVLAHPTRGLFAVLDLLLNYRAFKQVASPSPALGSNSSSSLPAPNPRSKPRFTLSKRILVRKHAYFVQRFLPLTLISSRPLDGHNFETYSNTKHSAPSTKNAAPDYQNPNNSSQILPPLPTNSSSRIQRVHSSVPFLYLIVPVSGRTMAFHRFLRMFELLVLRPVFDVRSSPMAAPVNNSSSHLSATWRSEDERERSNLNSNTNAAHSSAYAPAEFAELSRTGLLVVSVGSPEELRPLHALMTQYPRADLRLVHEPRARNMTRAAMLNLGALAVRVRTPSDGRDRDPHESEATDPLLVFVDVDMLIDRAALQRLRLHPARGRQAYFPIVLSEHEPNFLAALDRHQTHANIKTNRTSSALTGLTGRTHYWRQFGFGICAMYSSDFFSLGTWDERIVGWGLEDIVCSMTLQSQISCQ